MKNKSVLVLCVLFFLVCFSVSSESIQYVYRNTLSTTDVENMKRGAVYTDSDNNIFVIRKIYKDIALFDHIFTKKELEINMEIKERSALKMLSLSALNSSVGVSFSFTTILYPLKPLFSAGYSFSFKRAFLRAGFAYDFALGRIFNTNFTLLEDAFIEGYFQAGIIFYKPLIFEVTTGIGYRHNVNSVFFWGLDYMSGYRALNNNYASFREFLLTVGVNL